MAAARPPRAPGAPGAGPGGGGGDATSVPGSSRPAGDVPSPSVRASSSGSMAGSGDVASAKTSKSEKRSSKRGRKKKVSRSSTARERRNFQIHQLYVRQEYRECLKVISKQVRDYGDRSEFALYTKALIKRQMGEISESLSLLQKCQALNPSSTAILKEVARSLYLLGKFRAAIDIFDQVQRTAAPDDWEVWHSKGVCFTDLGEWEMAVECLRKANKLGRHHITYMALGRVYSAKGDLAAAIDIYQEALDYSPNDAELLTTLGLLYLRQRQSYRGFEYLGNALTIDPSNARTILGAGSIISDHGDFDVALVKYRVAAVHTPDNPQLWNNIAMCFYGKGNYLAAIVSLKKALYLAPMEWIITFNLGLAHLQTTQFASAYHFLSATVNIKPDYGPAYMYLGVALSHMGDLKNARQAYERATKAAEDKDHMIALNHAVMLVNAGDLEAARARYRRFVTLFDALDNDAKSSDPTVKDTAAQVAGALGESPKTG
jgi:Bardet-Biedl syndrome 4 protein